MFKRMMYAFLGLAIFAAIPAFAANDCKKGTFVGSYTRADLGRDVFGDGTVIHNLVFQLNLHSDGTATEIWTGSPDYILGAGTGSESRGSWACRSDGKLVVTFILAGYGSTQTPDPFTRVTITDVALAFTSRVTYLFTINSDGTLTRIQSRAAKLYPLGRRDGPEWRHARFA